MSMRPRRGLGLEVLAGSRRLPSAPKWRMSGIANVEFGCPRNLRGLQPEADGGIALDEHAAASAASD